MRRKLSGYQVIHYVDDRRSPLSSEEAKKGLSEEFEIGFKHELDGIRLSSRSPTKQEIRAAIMEMLDDFILEQAKTLGDRIFACDLAAKRISAWKLEPIGPGLFEQIGKAMADSARILQRKKRVPVTDPALYELKTKSISELRILLSLLKTAFGARRTQPLPNELATWIRDQVTAQKNVFPLLFANLSSLLSYLQSIGKESGSVSRRFVNGAILAPELFQRWCGHRFARDPETLRQMFSELGSKKRLRKL
jgi:hypothetical protein